jgi:membrane protease subunit HflK
LLNEYEKAPEVTRERLYIDAVEYVYRNANKVLLDAKGSGNLLYLPIDKLMQQRQDSAAPTESDSGSSANSTSALPEGSEGSEGSNREVSRTRGAR